MNISKKLRMLRMGVAVGAALNSGDVKAEEHSPDTPIKPTTMMIDTLTVSAENGNIIKDYDIYFKNLAFENGRLTFKGEYCDLDVKDELKMKKVKRQYRRQQRRDFRQAEKGDVFQKIPISIEKVLNSSSPLGQYQRLSKYVEFPVYEIDGINELAQEILNNPERLDRVCKNLGLEKNLSPEKFRDSLGAKISNEINAANDTTSFKFKSVKVHEYKHMQNDKQNLYEPGLSLEQKTKLICHDELSATIKQLLLARKEVRKSGSWKIFDESTNQHFDFYRQTMIEKQIKFGSEEEMSLIANGSFNLWENKYQNSVAYQQQQKVGAGDTFNDNTASLQPNFAEYNKRIEKIYQFEIDGKTVNLHKYLKKDFELSEDIKEEAKLQHLARTNDVPVNFLQFAKKNITNQKKLEAVQNENPDKKQQKFLTRLIKKYRGVTKTTPKEVKKSVLNVQEMNGQKNRE